MHQWDNTQEGYRYSDDWGRYDLVKLYDSDEGGQKVYQGWQLSLDGDSIALNERLSELAYASALMWAEKIIELLYIRG